MNKGRFINKSIFVIFIFSISTLVFPQPPPKNVILEDYISMLFVLDLAIDVIPSEYDMEIEAKDLQILESVPDRMEAVRVNLISGFKTSCSRYESGLEEEGAESTDVAQFISNIDFQESFHFAQFYYQILGELTNEIAHTIEKIRAKVVSQNETGTTTDWNKMAELEPEKLPRIQEFCNKLTNL